MEAVKPPFTLQELIQVTLIHPHAIATSSSADHFPIFSRIHSLSPESLTQSLSYHCQSLSSVSSDSGSVQFSPLTPLASVLTVTDFSEINRANSVFLFRSNRPVCQFPQTVSWYSKFWCEIFLNSWFIFPSSPS